MSQEIVIDPELQRAAKLKNSKLPQLLSYSIGLIIIVIIILVILLALR